MFVVFLCMFQDWALGVLHAKIIAAITLMGPQWWLKTVIEQVVICSNQYPLDSYRIIILYGIFMMHNFMMAC